MEIVGEGVDLGSVVGGGHGDSQAGSASRNCGWADRLDMPAAVDELSAQRQRRLVAAEEDAKYWSFVVGETEVIGESLDVGPQASAA